MLTSEIVQQVKRIEFVTGHQVADVLAGAYHSVFKGRGIEFDEVRPYVPGDDVRSIDWNVTARMGEPYIKRYVEERELTVMLLVDVSASLDFGSADRSKLDAAVELSALIALSAIQNDDKVGLLLFHGQAEEYIPARKGKRHAMRVVREVLSRGAGARAARELPAKPRWGPLDLPRAVWHRFRRLRDQTSASAADDPEQARRATNISHALDFCHRVLPRRTVLFLISDFLDEGYLELLRSASRRHDLVAAMITDERELSFESAGLINLQDAETGDRRLVDTGSRAFRDSVADNAKQRLENLEVQLRASNVDLLRIDATRPVIDPLVEFFTLRKRRRRRR